MAGLLVSLCSSRIVLSVGIVLLVAILFLVGLCVKHKLSNNQQRKGSPSGNKAEIRDEEQGFGEGGLWQKGILMGDKCRPLDYSGVIYYDAFGNSVPEMPRSPNLSPTPLRCYTSPLVQSPRTPS